VPRPVRRPSAGRRTRSSGSTQRAARLAARLRGGVRRSATCWIAAGTSR
jgi:hypothetical protein